MGKNQAASAWHDILLDQRNLIQDAAAVLTRSLGDPALSLEEASSLYRAVETGARTFDAIASTMDNYDLDDSFHEAARTLQKMWSELSIAAASKVKDLQGLEPIALAEVDN